MSPHRTPLYWNVWVHRAVWAVLGLALALGCVMMALGARAATVNVWGVDPANGNAPCLLGTTTTSPTCVISAAAPGGPGGGGTVNLAPTGQLQYSIVPKAGFASDGVTPITGYAACSIFKPNAGNLYYVSGSVSAGPVYAELFDSATIPADGALTWKSSGGTLVDVIPLLGPGAWRLNYGMFPAGFLVGITVCISSTAGMTKTAIAAGTNTLVAGVE